MADRRRRGRAAEARRLRRRYRFEREALGRGFGAVAGVDEVGRGALAGPVVAAAVVLPRGLLLPGLDDSKRLLEGERERLFRLIEAAAEALAVGMASVREIDRLNVLRATHLAMARAVRRLPVPPGFVLVDGFEVPGLGLPQRGLVRGDSLSNSVAAASVVAKVTRDRLMRALDPRYPQYGFCRHKGYGTREHLEALRRYGPCPLHRRSFSPVHGWDPGPGGARG
ncbi:MAG: ribonuclease HII [Acetobacteraceae bacterium]|nr:ribonuclease HII [Acetobacteraceae bacterium]